MDQRGLIPDELAALSSYLPTVQGINYSLCISTAHYEQTPDAF